MTDPVALLRLASFGLGIAGILMCMRPYKLGLALVWLAAIVPSAWEVSVTLGGLTGPVMEGQGVRDINWVGLGMGPVLGIVAASVLAAFGWFIEDITRRFGLQARWIDREALTGALIGALIGLFIFGSMLLALTGVVVGVALTEALHRRPLAFGIRNGFKVLYGVFGTDGTRLMMAASIAGLLGGGAVRLL